ncbi:unnamed protein product [Brachionus calyciflorus]|uniref:Major facilitator superfamily (MFS) profile domain-containing protein n=1 Tax=Brachionus calyciflorus TaxID=104777 RepID=A0A813WE66_9BILA|nr:unnamed protein product [Brachionus calyciflorus]
MTSKTVSVNLTDNDLNKMNESDEEFNNNKIKRLIFSIFIILTSSFQFGFNLNIYNKNEEFHRLEGFNLVFLTGAILGLIIFIKIGDSKMNLGIIGLSALSILASILAIVESLNNSFNWIVLGRFLFGIQGALSSCLLPYYVTKIYPSLSSGYITLAENLALILGLFMPKVIEVFTDVDYKQVIFYQSWQIIPAIITIVILLFFKLNKIKVIE